MYRIFMNTFVQIVKSYSNYSAQFFSFVGLVGMLESYLVLVNIQIFLNSSTVNIAVRMLWILCIFNASSKQYNIA